MQGDVKNDIFSQVSVIQTVNDTVLAEVRNEQAHEIAEENQDETQSNLSDNNLTLKYTETEITYTSENSKTKENTNEE